MTIDRYGVYAPMLVLEEGQTAEEIWHLIADNELEGLRVIADIINPLSVNTLEVVKETTFLRALSWLVVFENFKFDYDFLYSYTHLEKLHLQSYLSGDLDLGRLPKTLTQMRMVWDREKVTFSQENQSIDDIEIKIFTDRDCTRLSNFTALHGLTLYCDKKCKSLEGLEKLTNLRQLGIGAYLKSLQIIGKLTNLTNLAFHRFNIQALDELANLKKLKSLAFSSRAIHDISAVTNFTELEALSIASCPMLEDFSAIGALKKLKFLEIEGCKNLKSIGFVVALPNLEQLTLYGNTVVNDNDLKPAEHVERVYIEKRKKTYNIDLSHKAIVGKKLSMHHYIK